MGWRMLETLDASFRSGAGNHYGQLTRIAALQTVFRNATTLHLKPLAQPRTSSGEIPVIRRPASSVERSSFVDGV